MNTEEFKRAYSEPRNGTGAYHRVNIFVRRFVVTDGVKECADAGCYWLMDIFATELPKYLKLGDMGVVTAAAEDGKAQLSMSLGDNVPDAWTKHIDYTDLPDGDWKFLVSNDGEYVVCCLMSEY